MAEERINRKLAAILAADVVGYSRLMAADEAGTLAALKRHKLVDKRCEGERARERASGMQPAICSLRSTAGSPKGLTRSI
jgi:class 3 adenylate cyclase